MDGNDIEDIQAARFFLMAGIIHETAHWIAANVSFSLSVPVNRP
jgi:hypothetical protein